jgi:hypothetical protein
VDRGHHFAESGNQPLSVAQNHQDVGISADVRDSL